MVLLIVLLGKGVAPIEKEAFWSPSTTVANFTLLLLPNGIYTNKNRHPPAKWNA